MAWEPVRPRNPQPTRPRARRVIRRLGQTEGGSELCPLALMPINDIGRRGKASQLLDERSDLLTCCRVSQHITDAENRRGAKQSHGLPFLDVGRRLGGNSRSAVCPGDTTRRGLGVGVYRGVGVVDLELLAA